MKLFLRIILVLGILLTALSNVTEACTEVLLNKGQNKVSARNFDYDYPKDTQSMVVINPRNVHRKSITTDLSDTPLEWVSKYGSVSINVLPENACSDGLNEHGLTASLLFLYGTKYPKKDERPVLSYNFWAQYFLDNFKTVKEAIEGIDKIRVSPTIKIDGLEMPLHIILSDASGDSAIMEYIEGKLVIYHPLLVTVMTNSPPYNEMLMLVKKYKGFGGEKSAFGEGGSISRFVLAANSLNKTPVSTLPEETVSFAFDIIQGVTRVPGNEIATDWSVVRDSTAKKYYFRTIDDSNIRIVDLNKINFSKLKSEKALSIREKLVGNVNRHFRKLH